MKKKLNKKEIYEKCNEYGIHTYEYVVTHSENILFEYPTTEELSKLITLVSLAKNKKPKQELYINCEIFYEVSEIVDLTLEELQKQITQYEKNLNSDNLRTKEKLRLNKQIKDLQRKLDELT